MKQEKITSILHLLSYASIISIGIVSIIFSYKNPIYSLLGLPLFILWLSIKNAYFLPWRLEPRGAYIWARIQDYDKEEEVLKILLDHETNERENRGGK